MLKFQQLLFPLFITVFFGLNTAVATEQPVVPSQQVYTFHTALQSPIKELLDSRIKEAFHRLGLKAEVQIQPSSQRALILANEEGDGDAARVPHIQTIAPANTSNLIQVPEPIVNLTLNVYSKNLDFPVTDWSSLQNYHNGARLGAKILEKNIPGKTTFLPTTIQLVHMLDTGRIDTLVEWDLIAEHTIKNLGIKLKKLSPAITTQPFHLYLHKRHQDLVPKLNEVLRQMKADGFFAPQTTHFVFYTGIGSPVLEIHEKRLQEAFRRIGDYTVSVSHPGSSQRALVLANGDGDGDAARVQELKKIAPQVTQNLLIVPESINTLRLQVYSNKAMPEFAGFESLAHLRNGFRVGIKILERKIPGERIILPNTTRLLEMLDDGRIDTVIEWPTIADKIIAEKKYTNISKATPPLIIKPIYPYIQKRHERLIPKLLQALRAMKQDGTFSQIKKDIVMQPK